jgi:hypothetical protein
MVTPTRILKVFHFTQFMLHAKPTPPLLNYINNIGKILQIMKFTVVYDPLFCKFTFYRKLILDYFQVSLPDLCNSA